MSRDVDLQDVEFSFGSSRERETTRNNPRDPLGGKRVVSRNSNYKALRGIIKDTNSIRGTARVELEAGQRVRTFKLHELKDLE